MSKDFPLRAAKLNAIKETKLLSACMVYWDSLVYIAVSCKEVHGKMLRYLIRCDDVG
jgi:hypothetical protein